MDTNLNIYAFDYGEVYSRSLYMQLFKKLPSITTINDLDAEKAYEYITGDLKEQVKQVITNTEITCSDKKEEKGQTIFILQDDIIVELSKWDATILHSGKNDEVVKQIKDNLVGKKRREKRKPLEINLVTRSSHGMTLKQMEVKRTRLDIDSHYEDNFKDIDQLIQKRLNKKNDKGIVLLHGTPGTGKTTYLRYLIGKIKKRVLFLSPEVAANITNPDLIQLLIDNPESVLIIEDAENVIMQRHAGHDSGVSNLLNISDGLLSDFLNIQLICTFNSSVSTVDQALMRKGRLIAKYEFNRLSVAKAQALSNKLGYETTISKPMSLAEIFNQTEVEQAPERQLIGFRTTVMADQAAY